MSCSLVKILHSILRACQRAISLCSGRSDTSWLDFLSQPVVLVLSVLLSMQWYGLPLVSNCENDLQGIIVPRDIELEIDYLCTTVSYTTKTTSRFYKFSLKLYCNVKNSNTYRSPLRPKQKPFSSVQQLIAQNLNNKRGRDQ